MHKDRWFKFYTTDFLVGVSGLSAAQRGVYITLLCRMYEDGPLERNDRVLAVACGTTASAFKRTLDFLIDSGKITQMGDAIYNDKVKQVTEERGVTIAKNSKAALKRWEKDNKNNSRSMQMHSGCNADGMPIRDSSIIIKDNNTTIREEGDFETSRERDAKMRPSRLGHYVRHELWLPEWGAKPSSPEEAARILKEEYGVDVG